MSLIRWEPFEAMDDAFARMPPLLGRWPRMAGAADSSIDWTPSVDISETDAEYLLRAHLPAVRKEDAHVTFSDGILTISGERKQHSEEQSERYHRIESVHGSFSRSFSLPVAIDPAAIRAETRDGVLTVHVPKVKLNARKAAQIKIQ